MDETRKPEVLLRAARLEDADAIGLLLYEAGGPVSDAIFGFGDRVDAYGHLRQMASRRGGMFSWDITTVADVDGQVVGICSDIPGDAARGRLGSTIWSIIRTYGFIDTVRLLPRLNALRGGSPTLPDEDHQIINLAVMPTWRGRGIGSRLIERVHQTAVLNGSKRCSLTVLNENNDAQRLYERMGYKGIERKSNNRLLRMTGSSGLLFMTCEFE